MYHKTSQCFAVSGRHLLQSFMQSFQALIWVCQLWHKQKQPGQTLSSVSTHLQCDCQTDLQAARLLDIIVAALFSVYYIWGLYGFSLTPYQKLGQFRSLKL